MSERFFSDSPIAGDAARLTGAEAQHLARVMRAQVGDEVILFDGGGDEFTGRITAISKSAVDLEITERRSLDRELPHQLTLAVALPKGDRQKVLVEKLTELGVTRLIPLITQRGVAQPVESALDRLSRSVIEASKQCGRNRLMEIAAPVDVAQLAEAAPSAVLRLVAHPDGERLAELGGASGDILAAVGPEGGFTDAEVSALERAGWRRVALGPRILRIETAAMALAAWASLR
jgi:16S rRNA (uracil1498-N3)-methyltransferase